MLETVTSIAAALSDPTRVRILASLMGGRDEELCVCEVTDLLDLAPSTVSKHLLVLKQAGLVEGRRDGRWMHYRPARSAAGMRAEALAWVRAAAARDVVLRADAERVRTLLCCGDGGGCCEGAAGPSRTRVLFLCTGNSCRSQMAEGWARALMAKTIEAHSAGTDPKGLDPLAVRVMREVGVDISGQASKRVDELVRAGVELDVVVTVCDAAREACGVLPGVGARMVHTGFDDPPRLAREAGAETEEAALPHYRRVRDEIRAFIEGLPGVLGGEGGDQVNETNIERVKS